MTYRYPVNDVMADYLRAGFGLTVTVGPMLIAPLSRVVLVLLLVLASLFVSLAVLATTRQRTRISINAEEIRKSPGDVCLRWQQLSRVKLDYFSTRRDGRNGWMQLTLASGRQRIKLDSRLHGFERIAERAAEAALRTGIPVSPATASNFAALGTTRLLAAPDE